MGILALLIGLSACGFHLRGKLDLPAEMKKMHVKVGDVVLRGQLTAALRAAKVEVVERAEDASATLHIINYVERRQVRSVGGLGRVREFTLTHAIEFEVKTRDGKLFMKPDKVVQARDYTFDETQVVGKTTEETIIRQEMRRDLTQEVLMRLRYGSKPR